MEYPVLQCQTQKAAYRNESDPHQRRKCGSEDRARLDAKGQDGTDQDVQVAVEVVPDGVVKLGVDHLPHDDGHRALK